MIDFYKQIDITFFFIDDKLVEAYEKAFDEISSVTVKNISFEVLPFHKAIATPGNSFGIMDGGFDKILADHFSELQLDVFKQIRYEYSCEQPVGTCMTVPVYTNQNKANYILYAPTMEYPRPIHPDYVYKSMKAVFTEARNNNSISSLAIPGFGTLTGRVLPEDAANMSLVAYKHVMSERPITNWNQAIERLKRN